jgi:hypothetical protein
MLRPFVDYRELNTITIENRHFLPLFCETLDRPTEAKSKLDLRLAYHRPLLQEG